MEKYKKLVFLIFVLAVCVACAILPIFSFTEDEKILFGLSLYELQAYVYFGSSGIIAFLVLQYTIRLYKADKIDGTDYEKYSNLMLDDSENSQHIDKIDKSKS